MQPGIWPCPDSGSEYALIAEAGGSSRVLILPALFDEANKLRRLTAALMRELQGLGIASACPDLAGCNESLADLSQQSLSTWTAQAAAACDHFAATHVLTIRGSALIAPQGLPVISYAPIAGTSLLRGMLRAKVISEREAGREASREALLEQGRMSGLDLAGYSLSAAMLGQLEQASPPEADTIAQGDVGGAGLWLRAEPGHDPVQAKKLAQAIARRLA